jgi:hypothetical protein
MKTWEKVQEAAKLPERSWDHAAGEERDFGRSVYDHISLCGRKWRGERTWFSAENKERQVDCPDCLAKLGLKLAR